MKVFSITITTLLWCWAAAEAKSLYNTVVYDPETQNYYALMDVHDRQESQYHIGYDWLEAQRDAERNIYKGVRGRLAIVSSLHIHEFLGLTFRPDDYTWIGLRYVCRTRTLEDSAGRVLNTRFVAWARWWRQDPAICVVNPHTNKLEPGDFMPVAYTAVSQGFRWIGKGKRKVYNAYFIEYPTGGR